MRSPSEMDILVIDVTNRCFLRCSNCTRDIAHQVRTNEMTPETFRKALASLRGWWSPGRVIGIIGGEPTLNKHFSEICRIFREEFNPETNPTHGREPIADFNAFAYERLHDRSNGKGLWTSFGPRFMDHFEEIMDTFSHWNANDHSTGEGVHQTSLVDAREMCQSLGIEWREWPKYRDNCWLQNSWSASITPCGKAYFCERAAQLDLLYNQGKRGWDIEKEPEWWKRTPDQFGDQLDICEMCSMALPGPGQIDQLDRDIISPNHVERLKKIGSPAVKAGRYDLYQIDLQYDRRHIDRKDNYVAPSGIRVGQDNEFVYPKRISCVVVCVGLGDVLSKTLEKNCELFDEIAIVTTEEEAQALHDALPDKVFTAENVKLVTSNRCYEDGAAFNKGKMLNDGIAALHHPDWIVCTDADVFLHRRLREYLKTHVLNPGCLYYTDRFDIAPGQTEAAFDPSRGVNREPNGYFQLWNRRALAIRDRFPNVMFETFCSAGGVDSAFMQQWPKSKRIYIPEIPVLHIAHGAFGTRWNGLEAKPGTWQQIGVLTAANPKLELPAQANRIRLTDTKHGRTQEIDCRSDDCVELPSKDGGLIWPAPNGDENLGPHHVHVAALM